MSSHSNLLPAFVPAAPLALSRPSVHRCLKSNATTVAPRLSRRAALRMMSTEAEDKSTPSSDPTSPSDPDSSTTSAAEILKTLRDEAAADMASAETEDDRASRAMLGVYRDVDGRSNVWAVEPTEETDTRPQLSTTVIIAVAASFIIAALLVLPLLPFTNPDQL